MTEAANINRVDIVGKLVKRAPVRYTPVGVPVIKLVIAHDSWQPEADHTKRVQCEVTVQAQGEAHQAFLADLHIGDPVRVQGFLQRNAYREDQSWLKVQALSIEKVVEADATLT